MSHRLPWRTRAMVAAVALNLCGGSLYSLSVLLKAFETSAGLGRTFTAIGFSLAAAAFLSGVLTAPTIGRVVPIATHALLLGLVALGSLVLAAFHTDAPIALAGSAVAYGWCCGQFYSVALSAVRRSGFVALGLPTGVVVASFAVGSAMWSYVIAAITLAAGLSAACLTMGMAFALCGALAAGALRGAPQPSGDKSNEVGPKHAPYPEVSALKLWVGFFAISAAGLAVISQAAMLADSISFLSAASITASIGLANGAGRIAGGRFADRTSAPLMLAGLAGVAATTVVLVASGLGGAIAIGAVLVALAYGAGSAAYPAVLMRQCSLGTFPKSFARLFTAWGCAAILVPPLASHWFQSNGSYGPILTAVAAANLAVVVLMLSPTARSV